MQDLSDDLALTHRLLVESRAWKHRLVEQVALGSAEYASVRRSYQIELGEELFGERLVDGETSARVLLSLATLPKAPLLGFDLVGPDGQPLALEPRRSAAAVQASYLAALAAGEGLRPGLIDSCFPDLLLEAICAFTPAYFGQLVKADGGREAALRRYLEDGLGFPIAAPDLERLSVVSRWSGGRLAQALGEGHSGVSSSEDVLLAMPLLDPRPSSINEVVDYVERFHDGVVVAESEGADDFLGTLAEYGRRWELFTEIDLPIGTPTVVKMSDRRELVTEGRPGPLRGARLALDVALGEAASYHLAVSVEDEALRLGQWEICSMVDDRGTATWVPLASAVLEGQRTTPEIVSLYTSASSRPYTARVMIDVAPAREVQLVRVAVLALCVLAVVGCLTGTAEADRLGVVAVPTTFAVALLQLRERVSLLSRLQRPWNTAMLMLMVVVWVTVVARLGAWPFHPLKEAIEGG